MNTKKYKNLIRICFLTREIVKDCKRLHGLQNKVFVVHPQLLFHFKGLSQNSCNKNIQIRLNIIV